MAKWQRTRGLADKREAGYAVGTNVNQPRVFTGQTRLNRRQIDELLRKIAAPLGDSAATEIVAPSGQFYKVEGISQPGGTDVDRP